jgi:uncharacterized RDD family membrane protein YckC
VGKNEAMDERSATGQSSIPAAAIPAATGGPPARYTPRFGQLQSYFTGRFIAFVIDVFGMAFIISTFFYHAAFEQLATTGPAPLVVLGANIDALRGFLQGSFSLLACCALVAALAFMWICETIAGSTLGKLLFGLAIRRSVGGRAGPIRIVSRNLFRPIDAIVVGGLLALITPKHQRLGDFAGGTIVVRSPLGFFASAIAICAFGALFYGQVMFGGGLASAAGVLAQSAVAVPQTWTRLQAALSIPSTIDTSGATAAPSAEPSQ